MEIDTNARCILVLEELSTEIILMAKHGIRDCFVEIVKLDPKEIVKWAKNPENSENVENGHKELLVRAGSVRSHCKWIPTKKVIQDRMKARLG